MTRVRVDILVPDIAPKDTLVTAALNEMDPTITSPSLFPKKGNPGVVFREHDHAWAYLLCHSVSSGHEVRQAQWVSGFWLGAITSSGRKLWPCVPGIQQASCGTAALPKQGVLGLHHGFQYIKWKTIAFCHQGNIPSAFS